MGSLAGMGIQLGALSAMAPKRRKDFAVIALRALIAGNIACHMTACVAGIFRSFSICFVLGSVKHQLC